MKVYFTSGPLKGRRFASLTDAMQAQVNLQESCKHMRRFRKVRVCVAGGADQNNVKAYVGVKCTRCGKVLWDANTPKIPIPCPHTQLSGRHGPEGDGVPSAGGG